MALALQRCEWVSTSRDAALEAQVLRPKEISGKNLGGNHGVKPNELTIENICGYDVERLLEEHVQSE